MTEPKFPTVHEILSISALMIEAMDPRITVGQRNHLCLQAAEIDPFTSLICIAGMSAGVMGQWAKGFLAENVDEILDGFRSLSLQEFGHADFTEFGIE